MSQQGEILVQRLRILTEVSLYAVDLLGFRFRHIVGEEVIRRLE